MSNLLIVESPAKAKTINKYLGKDFTVLASYGHIRDLIPKEGAVDPDNDFAMAYEVIDKNSKHVDAITRAAKKADAIYLATDLDREGEAISWHVYEILKEKGLLDKREIHRVVFSEITKRAIQAAMEKTRDLSLDMINAQQARRALDYLVGFNLSPLLWKKIKRGLSAGRVQSPALRMIVEREEEIERFEPREYWSVTANLLKAKDAFNAKLTVLDGDKVKQFTITNGDDAKAAYDKLTAAASGSLKVKEVRKKERKRRAAPPFTTSTLQQEASRKLGFTAQRTMRVAQQLYEGIDIGGQSQGLITYMRTDSVHLAGEALNEIRNIIAKDFGDDNVPEKPNFYKTKSKNAQEAHEAIRPTSAAMRPKQVKQYLSQDQARLYELIWKRTMASQMIYATMETVSVDLACGDEHEFRATGSTIKHAGFLSVYEEDKDDVKDKDNDSLLPPMKEGEVIDLTGIDTKQHFTEPPPRFTEASLVKALEEFGIGRPSTYASIISTLVNREYVELESRRFQPTDVGRVVSKFLSEHFTQYVDYDFTARLEDELDEVSRGERDWVPLMREFWTPFKERIDDKEQSVSRAEAIQARELGADPKTGKPVSVRLGRYGPYAQIGTKDDEEKPQFAGLRPGQKMDTVTLEEALKLFDLPRELGETQEGEKVEANIGRYGPYVRYGKKFVSIPEGEDPYKIELERALELIAEKKELDANRVIQTFKDGEIEVLRGRYGPYITDGKKNGKIPKDKDPEELTLEECVAILEAAPARKKKGRRKKKSSA